MALHTYFDVELELGILANNGVNLRYDEVR